MTDSISSQNYKTTQDPATSTQSTTGGGRVVPTGLATNFEESGDRSKTLLKKAASSPRLVKLDDDLSHSMFEAALSLVQDMTDHEPVAVAIESIIPDDSGDQAKGESILSLVERMPSDEFASNSSNQHSPISTDSSISDFEQLGVGEQLESEPQISSKAQMANISVPSSDQSFLPLSDGPEGIPDNVQKPRKDFADGSTQTSMGHTPDLKSSPLIVAAPAQTTSEDLQHQTSDAAHLANTSDVYQRGEQNSSDQPPSPVNVSSPAKKNILPKISSFDDSDDSLEEVTNSSANSAAPIVQALGSTDDLTFNSTDSTAPRTERAQSADVAPQDDGERTVIAKFDEPSTSTKGNFGDNRSSVSLNQPSQSIEHQTTEASNGEGEPTQQLMSKTSDQPGRLSPQSALANQRTVDDRSLLVSNEMEPGKKTSIEKEYNEKKSNERIQPDQLQTALLTSGQPEPIAIVASPSTQQATAAERVDAAEQIISQMVNAVSQIEQLGRTDTVVNLNHPPQFRGVQLVVTEFDSASNELNLTFANVKNPQVQKWLDDPSNLQKLRGGMNEVGFVVQRIDTTHEVDARLLDQNSGQNRGDQSSEQGNRQGRDQSRNGQNLAQSEES